MTDQQLKQQLDDSMPDIIGAMKLKREMYQREINTATVFGGNDPANKVHIQIIEQELTKITNLIDKLENN